MEDLTFLILRLTSTSTSLRSGFRPRLDCTVPLTPNCELKRSALVMGVAMFEWLPTSRRLKMEDGSRGAYR